MRRTVGVLCGIVLSWAGAVSAQQPTSDVIARSMELARPGPEHATLARLAGTWEQQIRVWPEPGAEPVVSTAVAHGEMILGGRFLRLRSEIEMFGMQVETVNLVGFDRRHERYNMVGLDTFGTYWVTASGPAREGNVISMHGQDVDPVIGGTQEYEFRFRIDSPDQWTMELVFLDDAHTRGQGPFRMIEIVNRRRAR